MMGSWVFIPIGLALAVLLLTGSWRVFMRPFAIRPRGMTVNRLGLSVTSPEDVDRINRLLGSFTSGFNAMITARTESGWRRHCESIEPLFRPFAEEGVAMGYTLRRLFRYEPGAFEESIVKPRPEFRYLHYVGLGFWSGMRNHGPHRLARVVEGLDPLHRFLCYDGYGFKHAFFQYLDDPDILHRLDRLDGYARNAAYQGVGRAFYFLFMNDPQVLIEHIRRTGAYAEDVASGVGLAAAFVNPDRLAIACELAVEMPQEWRTDFHLGMCFALKARMINDRDLIDHCVAGLQPEAQDAVWASIRECDRVELLIRSEITELEEEGYRKWRRVVAEWLADNIEYPMAGVRDEAKKSVSTRTSASA